MLTIDQLTKDELSDFLKSIRKETPRKRNARDRIDAYQDRLAKLVQKEIGSGRFAPEVTPIMQRIAKSQPHNALKTVTDLVAGSPYLTPPQRTIASLPESEESKWKALQEETKLDLIARQLCAYAFVCNVVYSFPRMRVLNDVPAIEIERVLPHQSEVMMEPSYPSKVAMLGWIYPSGHICIADALAYHTFDNKDNLILSEPHGLGCFPGTEWRFDLPEGDYWSSDAGSYRLTNAIEIGIMYTRFRYVRGMQDAQYPIQIQDTGEMPEQTLDPGQMNMIPSDGAQISKLDLQTSPDPFIKCIRSMLEDFLMQEGVTGQLMNFDSPFIGVGNFNYSRLAERRKQLIAFLRDSELDISRKIIQLAAMLNLPNAIDPTLAPALRIIWNPLDVPKSESEEISQLKNKMDLGLASPITYIMEKHPGLSESEAQAIHDKMIAQRNNSLKDLIMGSLPEDITKGKTTVAQIQGAIGGKESADKKKEDGDTN